MFILRKHSDQHVSNDEEQNNKIGSLRYFCTQKLFLLHSWKDILRYNNVKHPKEYLAHNYRIHFDLSSTILIQLQLDHCNCQVNWLNSFSKTLHWAVQLSCNKTVVKYLCNSCKWVSMGFTKATILKTFFYPVGNHMFGYIFILYYLLIEYFFTY